MNTYTDDELREIRINALWGALCLCETREQRKRIWYAMAREINARSPEQQARMERERGLA